jgi:hypothetical protein
VVAHSLHRHSESLVNAFERVALRVVQEIMKHQYSPTGPTLGSYKGEFPFQARPPLPYVLAALESHGCHNRFIKTQTEQSYMRQDQVTHIYNRIIKISQHISRNKSVYIVNEFFITTESRIGSRSAEA